MPTYRADIAQYQYLNDRPSPDAFGIGQCQVAGREYTSDGVTWFSPGPLTLFNQYIGCIVPSLAAANAASYSQSGTTITVTSTGHNIPSSTAINGKDVYLTPGVAATGATLPTGIYTNFQYVDANTFTCQSTVSQIGTGSAMTTQIATPITLPQINITVPAGVMGLNGYLDIYSFQQCNASAGAKRIHFLINGGSFKNPSPGATIVTLAEQHRLQNMNSFTKQLVVPAAVNGLFFASSVAATTLTLNTAADMVITATATLSAASDYVTLEHTTVTSLSS